MTRSNNWVRSCGRPSSTQFTAKFSGPPCPECTSSQSTDGDPRAPFPGLRKAAGVEGIYALLGAGAASALGIFHPSRDLVFGNRLVHCRMDLRGPSNERLIRYGHFPSLGRPPVNVPAAGSEVRADHARGAC